MTSEQRNNQVDHYSIFCGSFLYAKDEKTSEQFYPWEHRVSSFDGLLSYLGKTYHDHYINHLFAEGASLDSNLVVHQTNRELLDIPFEFCLKSDLDHVHRITWFDRYLFPDGLGIFAFKVELQSKQRASYETISNLIRNFRSIDCELIAGEDNNKLGELISRLLLPGLRLSSDWDKHLPKLKHYTVLNDNRGQEISEEMKSALFELAHAMPLGSVTSRSTESPTEDYYQKVFRDQAIDVYANWKAIALLDSFTRLSVQFEDTYRSCELDYFHIYIYCLYSKYKLHQLNDQYTAATRDKKKAAMLKESFAAFIGDYSLTSISHKFLPNLLFEKMRNSMDLEKEMEALEKKMTRLSEMADRSTQLASRDTKGKPGSSIIRDFDCDVFVSYQSTDNRQGWVTQFAEKLHDELSSIMKEPVNLFFRQGDEETGSRERLNSLIMLPVLSPSYCNKSTPVWREELLMFAQKAKESKFSIDVKLRDGNVSSRILPVCIYDLDSEDKQLYEKEVGLNVRSIDFIYREPGVSRPLKPEDQSSDGRNSALYRNQINKLANAIKEAILGMKRAADTA